MLHIPTGPNLTNFFVFHKDFAISCLQRFLIAVSVAGVMILATSLVGKSTFCSELQTKLATCIYSHWAYAWGI